MEKIITFDTNLTAFILNLPHPFFLNLFFGFFSFKGMAFLIWILIFIFFVIFEEKRNHQFFRIFIFAITISFFVGNLLKVCFRRPRPKVFFETLKKTYQIKNFSFSLNYPQDFSFPSGHASFSFSAASVLSSFDRKRRKIFYLIAFLIAFSRVYLGYHFIFDVIAGGSLGWIIGKIFLKLSLRFKYKSTLRV